MIYLRVLILLLLLLNIYSIAFSQQSNTMYFMDKVPQSNFLNPAKQYACSFYMGIPILSSIHLNVSNTAFSYNDVFSKSVDSYMFDIQNALKMKHKLDMLSTEIHLNIISFGYRRKSKYYSFSLTEKNEIYFSYPGDIVQFALKGNGGFAQQGKIASLYKMGINALHYREYAFGKSKKIDDYLTLGVRAKLLFGKANINTKSDISIRTKQDYYDLTVKSNTLVNVSAPVSITQDNNGYVDFPPSYTNPSIMSLIFNRKNPGLSFDGGLLYKNDDFITYSASFVDLGFIWWRADVTNIKQDGIYTFKGLSDADMTSGTLVESIIDNVRKEFSTPLTNSSYITMLPLKLHVGATYKLNKKIDMGILARGLVYQLRMYPSLVLSANTNFSHFFTASLTYAFNNYSFNNLGLSIALQSKHFQYYMITDNFYGMIKPMSTRNINLRFGFNLIFGCNKKVEVESDFGCHWIRVMENKNEKRSEYLSGKLKKKKH